MVRYDKVFNIRDRISGIRRNNMKSDELSMYLHESIPSSVKERLSETDYIAEFWIT